MDSGADNTSSKRRIRPTQRLYVPPAQRNKKLRDKPTEDIPPELVKIPEKELDLRVEQPLETPPEIDFKMDVASNLSDKLTNKIIDLTGELCISDTLSDLKMVEISPVLEIEKIAVNEKSAVVVESTNSEEKKLVIMNNKVRPDKNEMEMDKEKEELQRAIVNINRKSRPLIKHVNTNNDILQIDVATSKSVKKSPVKIVQVSNWEDLDLEDEQQEEQYITQPNYSDEFQDHDSSSSLEEIPINPKLQELEHVIEIYDFPSTFKTQEIMTLYSDINKESMYIKWCDETHALLILGSSIQAQRALSLQHDIIKSRSMTMASAIAMQVASKSDLKPAMKRPQTSMHAARRMITTALGAKSSISREVQQQEREALRIAKELKRAQRQNERDAWEGNPRPSTA